MTAQQIHDDLRAALLARFPWLDEPRTARIPAAERVADWLRVLLFAVTALFCLSIPGFVVLGLLIFAPAAAIWLVTPDWWDLTLGWRQLLAFGERGQSRSRASRSGSGRRGPGKRPLDDRVG